MLSRTGEAGAGAKALGALRHLGFRESEARWALGGIELEPDQPLGELLRLALRRLGERAAA